jgi:hypothetical protein
VDKDQREVGQEETSEVSSLHVHSTLRIRLETKQQSCKIAMKTPMLINRRKVCKKHLFLSSMIVVSFLFVI